MPYDALLLLGFACLVAAVVGGGLKLAGVDIPVVDSLPRQVLLAVLGVVIIATALILGRDDDNDTDRDQTKAGLPPACVAQLTKGGRTAAQSNPKVLGAIDVHRGPADIAVNHRSMWVAHADGRVTRIPLDSRASRLKPLPGVRVGSTRSGQVDVAFGFQHVWVIKREFNPSRGYLAKIPPSGSVEEIEQIRMAAPDNVATGEGAVWVTDDEGGLIRIDPSDLTRRRRERVQGETHGLWAKHPPCVYVATTDPDGFAVFDAPSGKRIGVYRVGGSGEIVAGGGALWLTDRRGEQAVLRVDPQEPEEARRISLPIAPHFDALAASDRGVWTADGERTVVGIDPSGRRDPRLIPVAGEPVAIAIAGTPELVWVTQHASNQVTRIRP